MAYMFVRPPSSVITVMLHSVMNLYIVYRKYKELSSPTSYGCTCISLDVCCTTSGHRSQHPSP